MSSVGMIRQGAADTLLLDDFSIEQVGFSGGQTVTPDSFDQILNEQILGGSRLLTASGVSAPGNCESTECSVHVADGLMVITNGADCYGRGAAYWGNVSGYYDAQNDPLGLDLSRFRAIQIQVAEISGPALSRISIYSEDAPIRRLNMNLTSTGSHDFLFADFSGDINLHNVSGVVISTLIDPGATIAFDAVQFVIPEPTSSELTMWAFLWLILCRAMSRRSQCWSRNHDSPI